jgi:hypothetical protein
LISGTIGRTIVDNDKLKVGKTLAQDGIHRFANHGPTIEGRDNDTD